MGEAVIEANGYEVVWPDVSHIEIEDGAPVDNIFSERQMRLLAESLYAAWEGPLPEEEGTSRTFEVFANVGLFSTPDLPPVVPDVMVSLDVRIKPDIHRKENNTYFVWIMGKAPELAIEIVSNRVGGEDGRKLREYARIGVTYYVIYDPEQHLSRDALRMYELRHRLYIPMSEQWMPALELGLCIWRGEYEGMQADWLRWCDIDGALLPTGAELAAEQKNHAALAGQRAEVAEIRAEQAEIRAERLAAQLRALGVEPQG